MQQQQEKKGRCNNFIFSSDSNSGSILAAILLLFIIGLSSLTNGAPPACRFAQQYTFNDLLNHQSARDSFLADAHYWEGQFGAAGVGWNAGCGHTYDGHGLNYETGELAAPLHYWSAPSKESVHVMMLALALQGNKNAQIFISPSNPDNANQVALEVLTKKITTYEKWMTDYPGFGGYLPWVYVNDTGIEPAGSYWASAVPSLDNGENIWAIYALIRVLDAQSRLCSKVTNPPKTCDRIASLKQRYQTYLNALADNAYMMFYEAPGNVRAVTQIKDVHAQPYPGNYGPPSVGNYYLDDPYEGELFVFFLDLYGRWPNPSEREQVWINKRAMLKPVDLPTPKGPITVQKGYVYSSHEQWKYLEMPYTDVPINKRVFMNCERARTWYSVMNSVPGLFATVSNVTTGGPITQYLNAGIPELSFIQNISVYDTKLITPYGTFPTMLANQTIGLLWYWNMLMGPRMQGPYGSTESTYVTGNMIAPVTTWDSKITTIVGMNGGVASIVGQGLKEDGKYQRFYDIIDREWNLAFPALNGEGLEILAPTVRVPIDMNPSYFTECETPSEN